VIADAEIAALNAQIAPRTLTSDQQKAVVAALKPLAGVKAIFWMYPSDAEGRRLAAQLMKALDSAGLKVFGPRTNSDNGRLMDAVEVQSPTAALASRNRIASSLNANGIAARITDLGGGPADTVIVWVGVKPLPSGDP